MINLPVVESFLKHALMEDIGEGDITTSAIIPENHRSKATIVAKETFVLAGLPFVERIFKMIDPSLRFKAQRQDGDIVKDGSLIARITGGTRQLLMGERTALNFLQRLSGIATLTQRFVSSVDGLPVRIVDTRKTTPGFRIFEKYAVRVGGGENHRSGLFDGVLIKDNHISATGSIKEAIKKARKNIHHMLKIEVEVKDVRELRSALSSGAEIIMLDNMAIDEIRRCVRIIRDKNPDVIIEASGNINIENVRAIAEAGVDVISIGALTHSASAVDITMNLTPLR
jgi:nicotinate-nucleotide pyrophosphorylase (carboxylating)